MSKDGREGIYRIACLFTSLDGTGLFRITSELIKYQESTKVITATEHLNSRLADTYG